MAPLAVLKPRFVQILDEFSEEQSAQELDSWVDFGLCFIGLQGTTKKTIFFLLCVLKFNPVVQDLLAETQL